MNRCLSIISAMAIGMPILAASPPKPTVPLEMHLGDVLVASKLVLLEFGPVPREGRAVVLEVKNTSANSLVLDGFAFGPSLVAYWEDGTSKVRTRTRIEPNNLAKLRVSVTSANQSDEVRSIQLISGNAILARIVVHVLNTPPTLTDQVSTGSVPSGVGPSWSSYYDLRMGPAPFGYTLQSATLAVDGTGIDNIKRSCGAWTICEKLRDDDGGVHFRFSVQGIEERFMKYAHTQLNVTGVLTAVYQIKSDWQPTLMELRLDEAVTQGAAKLPPPASR